MAAMGRMKNQLPSPTLSACCRLGKATFGGTHGNEKNAPIPAVRRAAIEPPEPTQLRHWPCEFGASAT